MLADEDRIKIFEQLHKTVEEEGGSLMEAAADLGHREVVQLLHQQGAEIDTRDHLGISPINIAVHAGHTEVVLYFLEQGVDANQRDKRRWSLLTIAAMKGFLDVVKVLYKFGAVLSPPCSKDDPCSALRYAAEFGRSEVVRYLLEKGVNPEGDEVSPLWTPLCCAVRSGDSESVSLLVICGAFNYEYLCKFIKQNRDPDAILLVKKRIRVYEEERRKEKEKREQNDPEILLKKIYELQDENAVLKACVKTSTPALMGESLQGSSLTTNEDSTGINPTNFSELSILERYMAELRCANVVEYQASISVSERQDYEDLTRLEQERDAQSEFSDTQSVLTQFFQSTSPKAIAQKLANLITNHHGNRTRVIVNNEEQILELKLNDRGNPELDTALRRTLWKLMGDSCVEEENVSKISWSVLTVEMITSFMPIYEEELLSNASLEESAETKSETGESSASMTVVELVKEAVRFRDLKLDMAALARLNRAVEIDKTAPIIYLVRGPILAQQGQLFGALADYKKLRSLLPGNAESLSNLGKIYKHLGMRQEAINVFTAVLQLNPEDSSIRFALGFQYLKVGDLDSAIQVLSHGQASNLVRSQILCSQVIRLYNAEQLDPLMRVAPELSESLINLGRLSLLIGGEKCLEMVPSDVDCGQLKKGIINFRNS